MYEILLFLSVCVISCFMLSALHFDRLDQVMTYALSNIGQLLVGAFLLATIVYVFTP